MSPRWYGSDRELQEAIYFALKQIKEDLQLLTEPRRKARLEKRFQELEERWDREQRYADMWRAEAPAASTRVVHGFSRNGISPADLRAMTDEQVQQLNLRNIGRKSLDEAKRAVGWEPPDA